MKNASLLPEITGLLPPERVQACVCEPAAHWPVPGEDWLPSRDDQQKSPLQKQKATQAKWYKVSISIWWLSAISNYHLFGGGGGGVNLLPFMLFCFLSNGAYTFDSRAQVAQVYRWEGASNLRNRCPEILSLPSSPPKKWSPSNFLWSNCESDHPGSSSSSVECESLSWWKKNSFQEGSCQFPVVGLAWRASCRRGSSFRKKTASTIEDYGCAP